jgi:hypothetical protein
MAVSSTTNKVIYTGNGTTTFPYTFKIFADTDLIVTKVTIADETEVDLTLTTDYTVTDAGEEAGGNVELVSALTSAYKLVIRRVVPFLQATDYVENDNFPAESHEEALDRCAMRDQQLQEQIDRCVKAGLTETDVLTPAELTAAVASAEAAQAAAELAQTGAETAETNAEAAEINAELAETNAEAAQVAAEAAQAAAEAVATALAGDIVSTFTDADLTAGVLTITHNLDLDAPYPINALIFDNNSKQVLPDSVTGLANSVEIDLSSYGTLTGTWGYSYGLTAGAATLTPTSTDGTFAANSDDLVPTQKAAKTYADTKVAETAWTNYFSSSTVVGWGSYIGTNYIYTKKIGSTVFVNFYIYGVSNATSVTFTLPYNNHSVSEVNAQLGYSGDASGAVNPCGLYILPVSSNIVTCHKVQSLGGGWTNSGTKLVTGQFFYESA